MKNRLSKITIFTIVMMLALLLSSCASNNAQSDYVIVLTTSATEDISPYFTEAAETVYAQITETALAQPTETPVPPTNTPLPTNTASVTPSATIYYAWVPPANNTATPLSVTPSVTSTPSSYSCLITSQQVADGTKFALNEDFDAKWTVKNTGSETWDASEIDYRYVSGTSMHKFAAVFDFPSSVAPNESITITVDMAAPSTAAHYETFWAISRSSVNFCTLPLRINVE
jgi:hypothetical protein